MKVRLLQIQCNNQMVWLPHTFGGFILITLNRQQLRHSATWQRVGKLSQLTIFSFDFIQPHPIWLTQYSMCIFKYELASEHLQSQHLHSVPNLTFSPPLNWSDGLRWEYVSVVDLVWLVNRMTYSQCEPYAKSSASRDSDGMLFHNWTNLRFPCAAHSRNRQTKQPAMTAYSIISVKSETQIKRTASRKCSQLKPDMLCSVCKSKIANAKHLKTQSKGGKHMNICVEIQNNNKDRPVLIRKVLGEINFTALFLLTVKLG